MATTDLHFVSGKLHPARRGVRFLGGNVDDQIQVNAAAVAATSAAYTDGAILADVMVPDNTGAYALFGVGDASVAIRRRLAEGRDPAVPRGEDPRTDPIPWALETRGEDPRAWHRLLSSCEVHTAIDEDPPRRHPGTAREDARSQVRRDRDDDGGLRGHQGPRP